MIWSISTIWFSLVSIWSSLGGLIPLKAAYPKLNRQAIQSDCLNISINDTNMKTFYTEELLFSYIGSDYINCLTLFTNT